LQISHLLVMSKVKVNPSIESMAESGEQADNITPRMAIQCARASLLLSSLRPSTLGRSSGTYAGPGTEVMLSPLAIYLRSQLESILLIFFLLLLR
jgi:hypothetical protein